MKQFKSFAKRVATVFLAIAIICTSTSFEQLSVVAAETEDLVQVAAGEEAVQLAAITPEAPIVEVPATIETQSDENTVASAVPSDETPAADAQVLPISPSDEAPVVETPAVSENEVVVEIPDGTTLVYKVAFVGFEGADLGTVEVEEGQAAVSPEVPVVEGYTFTGWDADFTAVTSDITVNAIYEATVVKTFVVTFVGMEDTILGTADVVEGGTVAEENIPAEPVVEGYTFTGWDKDFSVVAEDMTVKAVFEESYPEFNGSVTIDGVKISAHADKGVIEAGANLSAELVALTDEQEEKIDEVSSFEEDTVKYGFDINILAKNGEKLQPVFGEDVQITFSNAMALDGVEATTEAEVVYVADDASTAEVMTAVETAGSDVAFDAEHFSIYVVVASDYRNISGLINIIGKTITLLKGEKETIYDDLEEVKNGGYYGFWKVDNASYVKCSNSGGDYQHAEITGLKAGSSTVTYYGFKDQNKRNRFKDGEAFIADITETFQVVVKNSAKITYKNSSLESELYEVDVPLTLPIPTQNNKVFKGWYNESNNLVISPFTPSQDITLIARWADAVTLKFDTHEGIAVAEMKVEKGTGIKLPVTTREGYQFLGWFEGNSTSKPIIEDSTTGLYKVEVGRTIHALWQKIPSYNHIDVRINNAKLNTVTITYDSEGNEKSRSTVTTNATVTGVTSATYTWNGVETTLTGFTQSGDEFRKLNILVPKAVTEIKVIFTMKDSSGNEYKNMQIIFNSSKISAANAECNDHSGLDFVVSGDNTVNLSEHKIEYFAGEGVALAAKQTGDEKKEVSILTSGVANVTKQGYTFVNWNTSSDGSGASYLPGNKYLLADNLRLYAIWEREVDYTIIYTLNGGTVAVGTPNPTGYNVETASFTLNNPTRNGYTFTGWTGTDVTMPSTAVTIPTGSTGARSYTANWTKEKYDVVFEYKNDLNVVTSSLAQQIEFETKATVPAIPNLVETATTYFTFKGWDDKATTLVEENYSNNEINNLPINRAYTFEAKYNEQPKMVQFFVAKEEGSRESSYSSNDFDAALTTKGTIKEYVGDELNSGYLEKVDYNSDDLKNDIAIAYPGYVIVWDRMVKRSDGYHIDGYKVANQSFTASAVGFDGSYTGTSHQITVTAPTEKYNKIYYSTTVLTSTNYSTAGSETNISVTNVTSSPVTVYYYVKAKDGYNDVMGSATITIAPAIITITALPTSKYFDVAEDPTLGYTVGDTQNNEVASFTGTLSRAIGVTAQTYAISQGTLNLADNGTFKAGNYEISFIGADFTIKTKSIAGEGISITGITDRTYNGLQQTQTFEVKDGTTKLIEGLTADYAISYGNNTNAGTASVTITGQGNYIGSSKTVTFKINPAKLSVSANALTKTYGENKYYSQKDLTYTVGSAQNGEQPKFGGMLNRAEGFFGDEVGTYPIYYKYGAGKGNQSLYLVDNESFKASNYEIVYTGSNLTVTPATITINIANTSKTVGSADPTFTATVSGNLLPEDMGQDLTYTLSRTSGENVGIYPIDASDIKALREIFMSSFAAQSAPIDEGVELPEFPGDNNAIGNYTIIVNKGTLTINAAPTPTDDGQEPTPTTPTTTPTTTITPGITATAATLAPSVVTFEEAPVALAARLRTVTPVEATVEEETPAMEADDVVIADENTALADEVTEIAEEETPLAVPVDNCPIHWLILILTAAYAIFEIVRGFARKKKIDELTEGESINKSDAKA